MTTHAHRWRGWLLLALALFAPAWCGCAGGIPRIDPTGRGLFVMDPPAGSSSLTTVPAPATGAAVPGCAPAMPQPVIAQPVVVPAAPSLPVVALPPAPVVTPQAPPVALQLGPTDTIAPVGSEVVLLATVPSSQQLLHPRYRVEWTVAPSSVGHIAMISQQSTCDWLLGGANSARKIDANYAISSTATRNFLLSRGTPSPLDDLPVGVGQTWVSITSPQEGVSFVSALAPSLGAWNARQSSARIFWVDAQWSFPPSTTAPAGGRQTLSTSVVRLSDRTPLAGYAVRYSIMGGAPAGIGMSDSQAMEVDTNASGEANIDIMQATPAAGTTDLRVEIIRPASLGGFDGRTLTVATGGTRVNWAGAGGAPPPAQPVTPPPITPPPITPPPATTPSAPATAALPQVGIEISTPPAATVGDTVNFSVVVTNLGTTPTPKLLVRDQYGPGLLFEIPDNPLENDIDPLQPGQQSRFSIKFTATQAGTLEHTVTVVLRDPSTLEERVLQEARGSVLVTDPSAAGPPAQTPYEPPTTAETPPTIPDAPPATASNDLQVQITGPLTANTGDEVRFSIKVTNAGTDDLHDVTVRNDYDAALAPRKVSGGDGGHQFVDDAIEWLPVGTFPAGKSKTYVVIYNAASPSEAAHTSATVTCREGTRIDDQATIAIRAAATKLRASIFESRDSLTIGRTGNYEVRLVNEGTTADTNVAVTVTLPPELTFMPTGSAGPNNSVPRIAGNLVQFPPLAEMRAGETLSFRVAARGAQAGLARVTAEVTSSGLARPIVVEEDTQVIAGE